MHGSSGYLFEIHKYFPAGTEQIYRIWPKKRTEGSYLHSRRAPVVTSDPAEKGTSSRKVSWASARSKGGRGDLASVVGGVIEGSSIGMEE
ncbi:hypothetical protein M5K25_022726 [Dendrobium thyrsiflorum]|uniref:Uncharacterized protein n=1 Tax=Dendrobium thyrsiflorum TaxID=117978 RepID=A0ABD0UDB2_DENTH